MRSRSDQGEALGAAARLGNKRRLSQGPYWVGVWCGALAATFALNAYGSATPDWWERVPNSEPLIPTMIACVFLAGAVLNYRSTLEAARKYASEWSKWLHYAESNGFDPQTGRK